MKIGIQKDVVETEKNESQSSIKAKNNLIKSMNVTILKVKCYPSDLDNDTIKVHSDLFFENLIWKIAKFRQLTFCDLC